MMTKPTDIQDFLYLKKGFQGWVTHLKRNCTSILQKTHFLWGQAKPSGLKVPKVTTQRYPNKTTNKCIRFHMNDMNDKLSSP